MAEHSWIEIVTAVGSILTPLFILVLTGIGWKMRLKIERVIQLEDKLREDRILTYNQILEPFIILFTSDEAWSTDKKLKHLNKSDYATNKMLSLEYKQQIFRLTLIGSDAVVKSYNNLMQHFYNSNQEQSLTIDKLRNPMNLLGNFLLEIRRSMGNESTSLNSLEMLKSFITDIENYE